MERFRHKIRALFIAHDSLSQPLWECLSGSCEVISSPGERCNAATLSACISSTVPDVVVLQLTSDLERHRQRIRQIRAVSPHTHVVVVAERGAPAAINSALQAGAIGYVYRDDSATRLIDVLQATMHERGTLDVAVATEILTYFRGDTATLTGRERRILRALTQGTTAAQIARREHSSIAIIESQIGTIILKMSHVANAVTSAAVAPYATNPLLPAPMFDTFWQQCAAKPLSITTPPSSPLFVLALCYHVLAELGWRTEEYAKLRQAALWRYVMGER